MILRTLLLLALSTPLAFAQPSLEAPASAKAGSQLPVTVGATADPKDFVTIVPKGSREGGFDAYQYIGKPGVLKLLVPAKPGEYEIRALGAKPPYATLARRPLVVESTTAALNAPAQVAAGAKFQVAWTGPNDANDFLTVVKAGAPDKSYEHYAYAAKGSPLELRAPDEPGAYEVRYLSGGAYATLGSAKLTVTPISATVQGPAEAVAGGTFPVGWSGPNNPNDYVAIVPQGAPEGSSGYHAYTARGNPASLLAPLVPGNYELRYSTGQAHATLARVPIRVTPGKQQPGRLAVAATAPVAGQGAVEIILDASGSMLLRLGTQRRIDIAKQTLVKLTSSVIPAGTPFALRVFGREVDSCQSDLDIPLGPLEPAAVNARMAALQVKNMARTPIGASLDKVAQDLAAVKGERLVILLTDGEETCGGDPAAAIDKLKKAGVAVRVNIVGFAIDNARLDASFRHWAKAGNGSYFSAKDAASLADALNLALRPGFEVVDGGGQVVAEGLAGGEAVPVMPGSYTVRLKGQPQRSQPVVVKSAEAAQVRF